jgi:tRNA pseudouridine38/39 synthase
MENLVFDFLNDNCDDVRSSDERYDRDGNMIRFVSHVPRLKVMETLMAVLGYTAAGEAAFVAEFDSYGLLNGANGPIDSQTNRKRQFTVSTAKTQSDTTTIGNTAIAVLRQLLHDNKLSIHDVRVAYLSATDLLEKNQRDKDSIISPPIATKNEMTNTATPTSTTFIVPSHNGNDVSLPTPASTQSRFRRRHIALQIYYDGGQYSGLAENVGVSKDNSIEKHILFALQRANLIESRQSAGYSRCGRTDRGVSAAGQVIALQLKSAFHIDATWDEAGCHPVSTNQLPNNSFPKLVIFAPFSSKKIATNQDEGIDSHNKVTTTTSRVRKELAEYSYDSILNRLLPPDIRVLGWCPVSDEFSARFSASSRTYRYFFIRYGYIQNHLDLNRMQEGLNRLVGNHDFRNFCKMDVEKVCNFVRRIDSATIYVTTPEGDVPFDSMHHSTSKQKQVCYMQIVGQAFLWHQIRCIASILFLVGRGLESPDIVSDLLDVNKHPRKPAYLLAPERPLVLHHCGFPNIRFEYNVQNLWSLTHHFEQQLVCHMLAAARIQNIINSLLNYVLLSSDVRDFVRQRMHGKRSKQNIMEESSLPFADDTKVPWRTVISFLESYTDGCLAPVPEPAQDGAAIHHASIVRKGSYTPLLGRSLGTTYEEKVNAVQSSQRRRHRYEQNIITKRQSKEVDDIFYRHKLQQGLS